MEKAQYNVKEYVAGGEEPDDMDCDYYTLKRLYKKFEWWDSVKSLKPNTWNVFTTSCYSCVRILRYS
jgi:hypothetical protein